MSTRTRIVDALGTVEGINAHPTTPDAPTAGDAWPVWVMGRVAGKLGRTLINEYDVLAILPAGYVVATVEQADGLMPRLVGALMLVGTVTTAEPIAMQVADSSTMPALRIRLTPREVKP
jgi:hypothetical protein